MAPCRRHWGPETCPNGKTRTRKEIGMRWPVSRRPCRRTFPRTYCREHSAARSCRRLPGLAIDSYWRAHPIRADRLARALAARSGAPHGWTWRLGQDRESGLPTTFRSPPGPYRERAHTKGPGFCCVCGQPVYRYGWHIDLWDNGTNKNATWHCACVIAWQFWNAPSSEAGILRGKHAAAAKLADAFGRPPRLITKSPCFGCGVNTGTPRGRRCSPIGACRTFK